MNKDMLARCRHSLAPPGGPSSVNTFFRKGRMRREHSSLSYIATVCYNRLPQASTLVRDNPRTTDGGPRLWTHEPTLPVSSASAAAPVSLPRRSSCASRLRPIRPCAGSCRPRRTRQPRSPRRARPPRRTSWSPACCSMRR